MGLALGSTKAILASCTNFAQRTTTRLDSARPSTHCRIGSLHCTALCFCAAPLQRTSCSSL